MSLLKSATALAGFVLAISFAGSAAAQLAVSDTVTFNPVGAFSFFEPTEDGLHLFFFNVDDVPIPSGNPSQYGSYTVLTEPDGTISDIFGVVPTPAQAEALGISEATFEFAFISDGETGLTTVPSDFINPFGGTPIILAEGNGGPFDATAYINPSLAGIVSSATFQSDAERVPEPATLALLGIGLAGLAFSRRQRTLSSSVTASRHALLCALS